VAHRFSTAALVAGALLLSGPAGALPPVADAGDDQEIPCASPLTGAEVTLDGSGSFDPDDANAVLTYTWSGDAAFGPGVTHDGVAPVVTLLPGVHLITLTVDDGIDLVAMDEVQITVVADSEPPVMVLSPSEAELWPPNHKAHEFVAADFVESVSDTCDTELGPEDVIFVSGTSDEADNGNGDGNTTGDLMFDAGCGSAMVRSERAGPGDGRVYELTVSVQDAAGNLSEPQVLTISVPHDRAHPAVDSGDVYEVTADACGPIELCPPAPAETCDDAGEASVSIKTRGKKGATLRWRAKGFAAAEGEFSDPATDYQLCVYTDDGATAVLQDDPAAPHGRGWKQKGPGAAFRGKQGGPHARLDGLKLKEKKGQGKLSLAVGGDDVALPELPLAPGEALVLQLQESGGECLSSTFDSPEQNTADRFQDRTD